MQNDESSTKNQIFHKLKNLFSKDSEGQYNSKLFLVSQCVGGGSIAGFIIGGRIGARIAGVEHIENNALAVYQSTVHAHRQYQSRVVLGFLRNGCRFGWRAGVFSGLYSLLLVTFDELSTGENNASNFIYAGALTGVIYKSLSGWRSVVVGGVIGSALSLPAAGLTAAVNIFAPDSVKEKLNLFHIASEHAATAKVEKDDKDETRIGELDRVLLELEKSMDEGAEKG